MDWLSPSERRGIAATFATVCLAFLAWAFPDMSRLITIPGAIVCLGLTVYFLWPEIKNLLVWIWHPPRKSPADNSVTPADIAYNGAIAAATVAWFAAFWRKRSIAIIAAVIACAAVGFDFWYGPPRTFIGVERGPWAWFPAAQGFDAENNQFRYMRLEMVGTNVSEKEITLDDAYFISGITGAQVHLKVQMFDKMANISDLNSIPPKAVVGLIMEIGSPKGLSAEDFLKLWGPFSFVAVYNETTQRIEFTREQTIQLVTRTLAPWPHVTLRNSAGN
jgi:hypothetical protein